jgi:adenylate cyclase
MSLQRWRSGLIAVGAGAAAIALNWTGFLQAPEWFVLDRLFQARSLEPADTRIVIVTIDETDIATAGSWPIPDGVLAQALHNLKAQNPRVIGLDIYRDMPVQPGYDALAELFRTTPNLIGAHKRFGPQRVLPPPVLSELGQVGIVDIVVDPDGRVRRDLVSAKDPEGKELLSLSAMAALKYLEGANITPEEVAGAPHQYQLGKAILNAFQSSDGGYMRVDDGGYQILLNYRSPQEHFQTISLTEVLNGRLPRDFLRDRIVLIGSTAESTNDFFLTPYDGSNITQYTRTGGVFIHANSISQLVSAALDGRLLLRTLTNWQEALWTMAWCGVAVLIVRQALRTHWLGKQLSYVLILAGALLTAAGLGLATYALFLAGWWIPIMPSMLGLGGVLLSYLVVHGQDLQRLAYFDGLTQVANRRFFDQQLAELVQAKGYLSLIMCDVDCFKNYNDTYGHQAGDVCLQQVATAIRRAVRRSDIVARYGGEEFAVILPHADHQAAAHVASRIVAQVQLLQLPHESSTVAECVTLSCGVVTVKAEDLRALYHGLSSHHLLAQADGALYTAKHQGRNRYMVAS